MSSDIKRCRNAVFLGSLNGLKMALVLSFFLVLVASPGSNAFADSKNDLTLEDCKKCHNLVFKEFAEGKSKHESNVGCFDCHSGEHPPKSEKGELIPLCTQCHEGTPHFELSNCTNCHHKPHQPDDIVLEGEGQKDTCGSCHPETVDEVNTHVTSHTGFACSYCHKVHRDRPNCLTCHEPHSDNQQYMDCIKCHQAHQPLTLQYNPKEIVNNDCGACHSDVQTTLETGSTKHAGLRCVFCHGDGHGQIPTCANCHKNPHDKKMIQNFESCNDCHQSAHDVIN